MFLFVVFFFQMRAVILGVMRKRKLKAEHLTAVDLATFGHLICGLYPSEIKRLSPYNLRSVTYIYPTTPNNSCKSYKRKLTLSNFMRGLLKQHETTSRVADTAK